MMTTDLTGWEWNVLSSDAPFVSVKNGKHISMPRICSIDMSKGTVLIEERFLKKVDEEGDKFILFLHLASSDAVSWVTTQLVERAKSPY